MSEDSWDREERSCLTCGNRCMDMDMEPYCYADEVREKHRFGLALYRGVPSECGPERKLWEKDTRR